MANQVVGTGSVEIIFDYEKNLKNMLSNVKKEWDKVDISKRLDGIDKSLDNLTKKTNENTKATNENAKAVKTKKDISEILKNNEIMLEKATKNSTNAQKEYIKTLQQQVKNGQELTGWQKERIKLLKEEDRNQNLNNLTLSAMAFALKRVGDEMFNYTKNAVLFTAQLEKTMAVTGSVAGANKEELQQLTNVMLKMGTEVPVRFDKISKSMYNMASAGLNTQEVLSAMPQVMKLAVGVGEDLNRTTELLISTVKSFDMSFEDSPRILDVFANSVAKSMATVEKLQVSFARVAPVAQNAGVSFEETTAILSKLYDLGLKGSNAGTVLGNVMTRLTTFTAQSTKALEKAGLSINDVSLEYNSLGESLAKVTLAMKENRIGAEQLQHIFGTRGKIITDFLGQLKGDNVDELTESYDELVKSISDASGAVDNFYGGQSETAQMALDKLKNSVDLFKVAIGEANKQALVPFASGLADIINGVAELSRSSKGMQTFIGILSGGTAVIGKSVSVLSSLGLAYVALKDIPWGLIIGKIGLLKTALLSFNPVVLGVTTAITALAGAFYLYAKRRRESEDADKKSKNAMSELKTIMEQNNGLLSSNIILTNDQIEAKKKLEKYTGTEITNLNELNKAIAENTRQTALNKAIKEQEKGARKLKESTNALGTIKSGAKSYKPSTSRNRNNTIWQDSNRSYESLVSSILTKYIPNWKKEFSSSFGYNSETGAFENIDNVIKKLEEVNSRIAEEYDGLSNKTEEIRTNLYSGITTGKDKDKKPKPEDDDTDKKTGFDPIFEARKVIRDKIDQITRAEIQKARTSGELVAVDKLNQNINDAIKLAFKSQNIANTITNSTKDALNKEFKDFNEEEFLTAVQNKVYAERVKLFNPEGFNFTEFSKTINDSLQTAKDYENNLNANIKGLKKASELLGKAGDNKELKKQAQDSINSFIEGINKSIPLAKSKIDTQKFINSITTGGKSPSEAILSWEKSISDAITFSKNEATKTLELQLEIIKRQIGKTDPKDAKAIGRLQRLLNDVITTQTSLSKLSTTTLSEMNYTINTYNRELKTQFKNSVRGLKNYYDFMISGIEDSGKLIDDYANATELQKIAIKEGLNLSLKQMGLDDTIITNLLSGLDTNYAQTKKQFSDISSGKIIGFKESQGYTEALKSYRNIKTKASGRDVLTPEEIAKTDKEFSDLFLNLVNLMKKTEVAVLSLSDKFDLIGSAIGNLANVLGSETLGKIGSGVSAISSGLTAYQSMGVGGFSNMFSSAAGFAGGLNTVSAGVSVAMMTADVLGFGDKSKKIEAHNNKSQEAWDTMISELSSINETLKDNFSNLIQYSQSLAENTTPTKTNLLSGQSQLQDMYDILYNQEREFDDIMFSTTTSVSKGLFKGNKDQKDNWTLGIEDVYSSLMNGDIQEATVEELQSFSDMLKNMSNEDLVKMYETLEDTTLSGYNFNDSNLDILADQIQNYVDILTKAYEQIEKFAKASTISDFVGMTYTDVDIIFEQLKEQYESMGVDITSEVETALYDLAQTQVIKETITTEVRDGFVDGWAKGQDSVEVLGSSLQSYFSGIMSNISKVFYDTIMNDFNDTLSEFYIDFAEGLVEAKELGLSPIDFANSQDYSSILNAIADAEALENDMQSVFETIRKQAEEAGISGALIDEMLGDEYRISIRENTSSAISSGIMDGFNNGEISEATIKNSIFSTIVQQAMEDIIDDIMTQNGIDEIMTQIVDALASGDIEMLEELGLALDEAINAGLDEASDSIEYLMGLSDKYSGTNTKPIVFFDESNLDSIQQTMTDYENFSLSSNDNLPIIETTKRIEINITASGDLSDEALSKIAEEVASEVKVEVSTSKYI